MPTLGAANRTWPRLEMRTAINLLLDRLPSLRLDPDADDQCSSIRNRSPI